MKSLLSVLLLVFITSFAFAQNDKDTLVNQLPVVNGKLVYTGSIEVKGRNKARLDSTAKKWFYNYFKYYQPYTPPQGRDTISCVLNRSVFEYTVKPALLNIPYYAVATIQLICRDNNYSYKVSDIYFRPKSGALNVMGFENSPEYLIKIYKQKHIGLLVLTRVTKSGARHYLEAMNKAITDCIASLIKAMAN